MGDYDLIPGDKLLPHPAVLERIAFYDPAAPQAIMDRAQEISTQSHTTLPAQAASHGAWHGVLRGVARIFGGAAQPYPAPLPPAVAINQAWAAAGDDMRQAIHEYMTAHRLDADKLGLKAAERESLKLQLPHARHTALSFS